MNNYENDFKNRFMQLVKIFNFEEAKNIINDNNFSTSFLEELKLRGFIELIKMNNSDIVNFKNYFKIFSLNRDIFLEDKIRNIIIKKIIDFLKKVETDKALEFKNCDLLNISNNDFFSDDFKTPLLELLHSYLEKNNFEGFFEIVENFKIPKDLVISESFKKSILIGLENKKNSFYFPEENKDCLIEIVKESILFGFLADMGGAGSKSSFIKKSRKIMEEKFSKLVKNSTDKEWILKKIIFCDNIKNKDSNYKMPYFQSFNYFLYKGEPISIKDYFNIPEKDIVNSYKKSLDIFLNEYVDKFDFSNDEIFENAIRDVEEIINNSWDSLKENV